jgi:predicted nucleic acid-binding protein
VNRGLERVHALISDDDSEVFIASLSVTEFSRRLAAIGIGKDAAREAALSYANLMTSVIPVDTAISIRAIELGFLSRERLPLANALIAACASMTESVLVHSDGHFGHIPAELLETVMLSGDSAPDSILPRAD